MAVFNAVMECFGQVGAERKVSFDHGREGSIAEDCFFSMIAFRDGYTFDFIEGMQIIYEVSVSSLLALPLANVECYAA